MFSQILIIIGLFLNLLGACKLYKSVIPFTHKTYATSGEDKKSLPVAILDVDIAKKGFIYIIFGIIFQIISIIVVIFIK